MNNLDANLVQAAAAGVILDRGVRYKLAEGDVTIRSLRFGTVLVISQLVAESGLTMEKIEAGEQDQLRMFAEYGELILKCVAVAELNEKEKLSSDSLIMERVAFYRDNLSAFQVYELFAHVLNLSGIQAFTHTIRLLLTLKERSLSPKENGQGS